MREFIVCYSLTDKEIKRLERITQEYRKQGSNTTIEEDFEFIMILGSSLDIDRRFKFHERKFGLRGLK